MAKQVSATYGEALFELAIEENKIDSLYDEAKAMLSVFSENEELNKLLTHPKVLKEEKIEFVEKVFKGRISETMLGFLVIVLKKDRQSDIEKIIKHFIGRVKEYKQIGVAYISSAKELDDAQKKKIEDRLLETTSYKEMEANYTVDESLIGGLVIRIGDRVVDSSIKTKLSAMRKDLFRA